MRERANERRVRLSETFVCVEHCLHLTLLLLLLLFFSRHPQVVAEQESGYRQRDTATEREREIETGSAAM